MIEVVNETKQKGIKKMTRIENAYVLEHAKACELISELTTQIENAIAPDESSRLVDWGHVGDLGRLNELLQQAVEILRGPSC